MVNVLVVEDNENIRKLIATYLGSEGYRVQTSSNGLEALEVMDKESIDLLVADIMMPGMDGYDLVRSLRDAGYTLPVLMITAKEEFDNMRQGFESGTDDYMVKPIDLDEMLLRISALLRRARISTEKQITIGGVTADSETLTVSSNERSVLLPLKEFMLLFKLMSYPGKIFTRQDLMEKIWGLDNDTEERTVDVHIKRLREKFENTSDFSIVTVRGLGYKLVKNP
ncbi:response regulator transcription factor [Alkalibacter rhizosphaerae]|uniref:Heme response regulator HssR n=1 Tax=Alkalibacter rhizosphaerae TaxID=2815577 RepID=A0A975AHI0_9FIRM|nr:response regulator transcription factor [Alkalibacter rhizosphaerae]QSX08033.1 response regulator transcription factor [Alkalibacter rhizosphaerae]